MIKLARFIMITGLAFSATKIVYALLMLSLGVADLQRYFAMLGREIVFMLFFGIVFFGRKAVLGLLTPGLEALVACGMYFVAILLLNSYVYGPILGSYAGFVTLMLIVLPIVVIEMKPKF